MIYLMLLYCDAKYTNYNYNYNYIRTRVSFAMLKSILVTIHGVRNKQKSRDRGTRNAADVAFGLIPEEDSYECR